MNISSINTKPRIGLAKTIDINIGNNINRGPCSCVSENSLQIWLNGHVRSLMTIKYPSPNVWSRQAQTFGAAILGYNPLVPSHASLYKRSKNINHKWDIRIILVRIRIQIGSKFSWRNYDIGGARSSTHYEKWMKGRLKTSWDGDKRWGIGLRYESVKNFWCGGRFIYKVRLNKEREKWTLVWDIWKVRGKMKWNDFQSYKICVPPTLYSQSTDKQLSFLIV